MSRHSSTALCAEWFLIYVPIKMPSKNAIKFWHDPYKESQSFTDKFTPLFSCDDIDDGLQNQAQVVKSLDFSVALYFKVKKNADHHYTQAHHTALHLSNKMMCVTEWHEQWCHSHSHNVFKQSSNGECKKQCHENWSLCLNSNIIE